MGDQKAVSSINSSKINKFYEIELQQVFDAVLSLQNLRVKLGTFFGTINLAAFSIAISTQKSGTLFIAAVCIWVFILLDYGVRRTLIGCCLRGFQLAKKFCLDEEDDNYFHIFMLFMRRDRASKLKEIEKITDKDKLINALRKMPKRSPSIIGFWIPLVASLLEILIALLLIFHFKWPLF